MENKHYYTDEKNVQIVIALLKAHGIRRVVANPGATNISFVASIQQDSWFEMYSGIDERHSAYLACGMAAESGEPVVLSCTGATASRNYIPALTEAYYRKLPILAVTSSQPRANNGQLRAQMIDRSTVANDVAMLSVCCPVVKDEADRAFCEREMNRAILELNRRGGGPVHVDLETTFSTGFTVGTLPDVRVIRRIESLTLDKAPAIPSEARVAVFCGSTQLSEVWESFVRTHNAVVISDNSTCGRCSRSVAASFLCSQEWLLANPRYKKLEPDLIIDIGEISGDYPVIGCLCGKAPVWRVSPDGEIRDRFGRLEYVFELTSEEFVSYYTTGRAEQATSPYFDSWCQADKYLRQLPIELPFSNPWLAWRTASQLPDGSRLHLGILNSLRSWNCFPARPGVKTYSNVGGFGIDGCVSSLIGAAIANPKAIHFGVFGDLAFLYDLNAIGNRHIGSNLRILVVNNGCGCEFNMRSNRGSAFGDRTNDYIAAGGHFAKNRKYLLRHFAEDNGFTYLSAESKDEYESVLPQFFSLTESAPILVECFTSVEDEVLANTKIKQVDAYDLSTTVVGSLKSLVPQGVKTAIKGFLK